MKKFFILFLFHECRLLLINFQRLRSFIKIYFYDVQSALVRTEIDGKCVGFLRP